jgi:hypothetical protein
MPTLSDGVMTSPAAVWSVTLSTSDDDGRGPAGEVVLAATVDAQLLGDTPTWARVAVVCHVAGDPVVTSRSSSTKLVVSGRPMPLPPIPDDVPQPSWDEVPHPPTAEDGPVQVLHLIRFADAASAAATPADMEAYTRHAMDVAGRHGGRIAAWFAVDETIVGDGRVWHQARFNTFPSKAAFMDVVFDPARLEAQRNHREVAIADTYTMILRPSLDALADSVRSTASS